MEEKAWKKPHFQEMSRFLKEVKVAIF